MAQREKVIDANVEKNDKLTIRMKDQNNRKLGKTHWMFNQSYKWSTHSCRILNVERNGGKEQNITVVKYNWALK